MQPRQPLRQRRGDVPHPIPYQGSKRGFARTILGYMPGGTRTLYEPFAGSAAVCLAAASGRYADRFVLNDTNAAVVALWRAILDDADGLSAAYEKMWFEQIGRERQFYDEVRDRFNATQQPADVLYLLARCVKAAVRYNARGQFNQSPDNRRRGARPHTMRGHLLGPWPSSSWPSGSTPGCWPRCGPARPARPSWTGPRPTACRC
jgi:DNA adenine methylase